MRGASPLLRIFPSNFFHLITVQVQVGVQLLTRSLMHVSIPEFNAWRIAYDTWRFRSGEQD